MIRKKRIKAQMRSLQNKLIIGTVQFGLNYGINNMSGQVSIDEADKILALAKKANVCFIDTSSAYGNSEKILGTILDNYPRSFNVISKYPQSDKSVYDMFKESLKQMKQSRLYGYLVHHFDFYKKNPSIWDSFLRLKEQKLVQKIEFSIYHIEELEFLLNNKVKFDLVQFPYNIFDRQFAPYLSILKNLGVEIHTRSVFLQGLFFKEILSLPQKLLPLKSHLNELHKYCDAHSISIEKLALGFVTSNPLIDKVLIGVDGIKQFEKNIAICNYCISDKDASFVSSIDVTEKNLLNPVNWN